MEYGRHDVTNEQHNDGIQEAKKYCYKAVLNNASDPEAAMNVRLYLHLHLRRFTIAVLYVDGGCIQSRT